MKAFKLARLFLAITLATGSTVVSADEAPLADTTATDVPPQVQADPVAKAKPIVADEYDADPAPEVVEAIKGAFNDLTPSENAEVNQAIKVYEHAEQFSPKLRALNETFSVKLHAPPHFELKLVSGYESELAFFDMQGKPWPVAKVTAGNTSLITAEKNPVIEHVVGVNSSGASKAGRSNLKVYFDGLDMGVSVPVAVNIKVYHDSMKLTLPSIAPRAAGEAIPVPAEPPYPTALDDPIARAILDNPYQPNPAYRCAARSVQARTITGNPAPPLDLYVFSCGDSLYFRTRHLTNPAPDPTGIVYGPDGYRVYRFDLAGEVFSIRSKTGQALFLEIAAPSNEIGARFDASARMPYE
ncbi:DotH/IcmK family type IV secretion protein [Marinobacterium stanieri]|uniref:Putative outer membrane core complex of type IVb secretion n=1 Tax=Marinobacterium stanieri TaxID=49186 RepID=A0A1N6XAF3_9GAMM|nr:DotH/IcmK family type IV secretion protein [Marinobacterium stanieri]SIQ99344.1 Putative outer membrane core complex of type IVb secretion [Marinobacterium stanieri]